MKDNNISSVELIELLEKKIISINKEIEFNNESLDLKKREEQFIDELQNDPFSLSDENIYSRTQSILSKLHPTELSDYLTDLDILRIVVNASNLGKVEFNNEEQEMFNRLIGKLKSIIETNKKEIKDDQNKNSEIQKKALKYSEIYDKFRNGTNGDKLITDDEVDIVLDLIKSKDLDYKKDILTYILTINCVIDAKTIENIENEFDEDFVENNDKNVKAIDESLIKDLFDKYGFEYDSMPLELKNKFMTKVNYNNMVKLFQFIEANQEYYFLKNYGVATQEKKKKKIYEEFKVLYNLFKGSSIEILDFLLKDAESRNIEVKELFASINGIYKNVSKRGLIKGHDPGEPTDNISGCHQYYRKIEQLFDDLSKKYRIKLNDNDIDFYYDAFYNSPCIFTSNPETIEKNIKIAELYDISLLDEFHCFRVPTMLLASSFCENIDNLVEAGCGRYLSKYSSIMRADSVIKKIIYIDKTASLDFTESGKMKYVRRMDEPIDLDDIVNRDSVEDIENQIPDFYKKAAADSKNTITKTIVDDVIMDLDKNYKSYSERNTVGLNPATSLAYNINGTLVSINKFKRVWTALQLLNQNAHEPVENDKLLIYSLTYGSYYSKDEVDNLQKFVNQKYGKGNK